MEWSFGHKIIREIYQEILESHSFSSKPNSRHYTRSNNPRYQPTRRESLDFLELGDCILRAAHASRLSTRRPYCRLRTCSTFIIAQGNVSRSEKQSSKIICDSIANVAGSISGRSNVTETPMWQTHTTHYKSPNPTTPRLSDLIVPSIVLIILGR
jgi:hypothetical protein